MAFIDEVTIFASAGKGGDGVVRWKREHSRPKGGPGGGNGGKGGSVYAKATHDLAYLQNYQHEKKFTAENGSAGENFSRQGKSGEDLELLFPVGSMLTNKSTGEQFEITSLADRILILQGGNGGLGNENFKSSTNTTPLEATPGQLGEAAEFLIELRLIADIGLVGFPNAGKSTLLNSLTGANSKVGNYAFTTLEPALGVLPGGKIMADIPGLIEGAHEGKGLGYKFLKHIARTGMIAHIISAENEDVTAAYNTIRDELAAYSKDLLNKKEIIVLSKYDMVDVDALKEKKHALEKISKNILVVSAFDDASLKVLRDTLAQD